ncbi:Deuterolysin metalloprotease family-domain-containing protein [Xylaria sp. CBS 124048]|nr:Deuterolysin metalloprotease family-domain-containing protein [Xylaria sp. CBS 124048]
MRCCACFPHSLPKSMREQVTGSAMVPKIVSAAALAGAAMATCPLSVQITSTAGHVAQVGVTNTAEDAVTVFKGNTVLLDHPTMDLQVSDVLGRALPFKGAFVQYKQTGIAPEMFQTIKPGQTVYASVNAASSYKLLGVRQAVISAVQGFNYVMGTAAPTSLADTEFCQATSNSMTIIPDQSKAAIDHLSTRNTPAFNSRIAKRDIAYYNCSLSQTSDLKKSVDHAISMSKGAGPAATSSLDYFTTWFKSTSVADKVEGIYTRITGVQRTSPTISCSDTYSYCGDGTALLYTIPSENYIVPCPNNGFWRFPELASTCADDDYDRAGSILHEISHLYGTLDYAYGQAAAMNLSADQAAANADTYEIYAGSVRLGGCRS